MNSDKPEPLSDDEDLPDLFGGNKEATAEKFEIAQHDIVWAEFRNLYWPALVRCVKKKERKASVWYLDSPRKCFKVPFKKIKSFSDPEMTALIKNEVENSPMKAKHKKVWLNAITYIRRKNQGYTDDPASFFDLNKHYLAYKDNKFDKQCLDDIENRGTALKNANSDTTLNGNGDTTLRNEYDDGASSEEESLLSDDDEETGISKKFSIFTDLDESYEDDQEVDKIVKCIVAGHVDKHLLQVKSRKVRSSHLERYEDALKSNKDRLMRITPTNHIKSIKKLKEVSIYLMNYYEKSVEGGKCEMVNYIMYVWVPEAIDKALELISKGSLNLDKTIPESRRKLFPTDRLVNTEVYDPIVPSLEDSVTKAKGRKRAGSKNNKKTQTKKAKVSSAPCKEENKPPIKSLKKECKPPLQSPKKKESKVPVKSPEKKGSKFPVKCPEKKGSKVPVKSPEKKGSKLPVKSPVKKRSKVPVKSPNNNKLPVRSSPRTKTQ
ncbi:PWWP domain-containing DNA repair factor 3B-like [Parasteatoda tepidariorum]|uniref:PWWP domain-containing DNA repair factor 3B-like n=1 Tax=Parasteatoda tepidariorum TaxID=114398 RepID=UPI0039BD3F94